MPQIYGAIRDKWLALGGSAGLLGDAVTEETSADDGVGRVQEFKHGILVWHPQIGTAFEVHGLIRDCWLHSGGTHFGYPITDETGTPDGRGRYNHFRAMHLTGRPESSIYWTSTTNAHPVYGDIRGKWAALGWERGPLGYPTGDEHDAAIGGGRRQDFENGSAVYHPEHRTFIVYGDIGAAWNRAGAERFGYPITDETGTPDGRGRYNHFRAMHLTGRPESSIYWTSTTNAHPVYGGIREFWASQGWEKSPVGYPLEAEHDRAGQPGREQRFEHGRAVWTPSGTYFDPTVFHGQITSGGLAALGGWTDVAIFENGTTRWKGHAHDSGLDGYDFGVSTVVTGQSGRMLAFAHHGHVGGTFTSGSPDHDWDEPGPAQSLIAANFLDFARGKPQFSTGYSSDIGSALESALSIITRFVIGSTPIGGALGVVVFIGVEVGSLISTGSLVPGARVVEGVLWLAGPTNTLLAIAAEGIASAGSRTRELTDEEYRWANDQVFSGTLPPRDRIVLTDSIGAGGRAFTLPRFDGKITVNMGPDAFDDPRTFGIASGRRKHGEVFVHELCHVWQIAHTPMDLALLADALSNKICEITKGPEAPYMYGDAGPAYRDFNLEQQAQIISDWFAGRRGGSAKDPGNPYFRYVQQNIRLGQY